MGYLNYKHVITKQMQCTTHTRSQSVRSWSWWPWICSFLCIGHVGYQNDQHSIAKLPQLMTHARSLRLPSWPWHMRATQAFFHSFDVKSFLLLLGYGPFERFYQPRDLDGSWLVFFQAFCLKLDAWPQFGPDKLSSQSRPAPENPVCSRH